MTPPAAHLSTVLASGVAAGDPGSRVKVVIDVFDHWHDRADAAFSPPTICWVAPEAGVRPA